MKLIKKLSHFYSSINQKIKQKATANKFDSAEGLFLDTFFNEQENHLSTPQLSKKNPSLNEYYPSVISEEYKLVPEVVVIPEVAPILFVKTSIEVPRNKTREIKEQIKISKWKCEENKIIQKYSVSNVKTDEFTDELSFSKQITLVKDLFSAQFVTQDFIMKKLCVIEKKNEIYMSFETKLADLDMALPHLEMTLSQNKDATYYRLEELNNGNIFFELTCIKPNYKKSKSNGSKKIKGRAHELSN